MNEYVTDWNRDEISEQLRALNCPFKSDQPTDRLWLLLVTTRLSRLLDVTSIEAVTDCLHNIGQTPNSHKDSRKPQLLTYLLDNPDERTAAVATLTEYGHNQDPSSMSSGQQQERSAATSCQNKKETAKQQPAAADGLNCSAATQIPIDAAQKHPPRENLNTNSATAMDRASHSHLSRQEVLAQLSTLGASFTDDHNTEQLQDQLFNTRLKRLVDNTNLSSVTKCLSQLGIKPNSHQERRRGQLCRYIRANTSQQATIMSMLLSADLTSAGTGSQQGSAHGGNAQSSGHTTPTADTVGSKQGQSIHLNKNSWQGDSACHGKQPGSPDSLQGGSQQSSGSPPGQPPNSRTDRQCHQLGQQSQHHGKQPSRAQQGGSHPSAGSPPGRPLNSRGQQSQHHGQQHKLPGQQAAGSCRSDRHGSYGLGANAAGATGGSWLPGQSSPTADYRQPLPKVPFNLSYEMFEKHLQYASDGRLALILDKFNIPQAESPNICDSIRKFLLDQGLPADLLQSIDQDLDGHTTSFPYSPGGTARPLHADMAGQRPAGASHGQPN